MMSKYTDNSSQLTICSPDFLVPENHLVRKLLSSIKWDYIYELAEPLYSGMGRPSIDPLVLIKMFAYNIIFGVNSMRRTCELAKTDCAFRLFLGYSFTDPVPHYSTWSQNYIRRFGDSVVFDKIFDFIINEIIKHGFLDTSTVYFDGTHIKANANKNRAEKEEVEITKKAFHEELKEEINADRIAQGKKPFDCIEGSEIIFDEETGEEKEVLKKKTIKKSITDPDSGYFHKGEHEKSFAYVSQTVCDNHGFVLAANVVAGNIHDSTSFFKPFHQILQLYKENIESICLDSGYRSPAIARAIIQEGIQPYMPYKRPMTKKGFFKKHEYIYHQEEDYYECPNNQVLKYTTTDKRGTRQYKSDRHVCENCPFKDKCTKSKNNTKVITRHIWADFMDIVEANRHTPEFKKLYPKRKETIERVFADTKEKMALGYTRVRGLKKNQHRVLMIFACHNLKKLALRLAKSQA